MAPEKYVGLDIGGTKVMAASADRNGSLIARRREPTPEAVDAGLALLIELVREVAGGAPVAAIGAAVGGPLDWRTGVVSPLHQPKWENVPLKEILEGEFSCPVRIDIDTNIAALGEYRFGEKCDLMVYMTISTGVGGGFLVDGRIFRGFDGEHPEIGHHAVPHRYGTDRKIQCDCGAPDCLEALISGTGIRRIYGKPAEELESSEWDDIAFHLGLGLRNVATLYAPRRIVIGGGVAVGGGERLLAGARRVLASRQKIVALPEVRLSRLGYDTALFGAVAAAIHGIESFA